MDLIVEVLPLLGLRLPDLVATQGFNLSVPPLELMLDLLVTLVPFLIAASGKVN